MRACRTRTPCSRCKMRQKRVSSAREVLCIASIAANVLTILRQILRYYAANVLSCYLPFLTLLWLHVGFVLRDAAKLLSILQEVFHEILRDAAPSKPSPPSPRKLSRCPASTSRRRAELRAGLARTRSFARDAARTPPRAPAPSGKDAPRRRRTVSTETTASDDARLPRIARRPSARRRATATRARERATPSSLARGGFSRTRGERGAKWPASRVLSCRTKTRAASATRSVSRNNFTYDSRAGRVVTLPRRGSRSHPHPARRPRPRPRPPRGPGRPGLRRRPP